MQRKMKPHGSEQNKLGLSSQLKNFSNISSETLLGNNCVEWSLLHSADEGGQISLLYFTWGKMNREEQCRIRPVCGPLNQLFTIAGHHGILFNHLCFVDSGKAYHGVPQESCWGTQIISLSCLGPIRLKSVAFPQSGWEVFCFLQMMFLFFWGFNQSIS